MLPLMLMSNDLTHCNRDGYGSMSNLFRASVFLAQKFNLTYVHHPLRCSHGVDWRVLGLDVVKTVTGARVTFVK